MVQLTPNNVLDTIELGLAGEKPVGVDKTEIAKPDSNTPAALRSKYAELSKRQVIAKFWRLYAFGLAASLSGMYMGYTLSAPGSIVANQGSSLGPFRSCSTASHFVAPLSGND